MAGGKRALLLVQMNGVAPWRGLPALGSEQMPIGEWQPIDVQTLVIPMPFTAAPSSSAQGS